MIMMRLMIDRGKLRTAIRRLGNKHIYLMLDGAFDLLPQSKLTNLVRKYIDPKTICQDTDGKADLLDEVKVFEKASLRGDYYESFAVNSKNCTEMSKGTTAWIAECHRLLDRCVTESIKGSPGKTLEAIDIIVGLLRHIDECLDDVVFFADEGGSWQLGVDWRTVLPTWFKCLSTVSSPDIYVNRVKEIIDEFGSYDRDKNLATARRIATVAQKRALDARKSEINKSRETL